MSRRDAPARHAVRRNHHTEYRTTLTLDKKAVTQNKTRDCLSFHSVHLYRLPVNITSKLYGRNIDKIVDYCVNRESCRTVYLQLSGDVAAMGYHCIDGYAEMVGNLFVGHTLHEAHYYVFLPVA